MKASNFFNKSEKERITLSIHEFEKKTSGEIRVHIENHSKGNALKRAKVIFDNIGMDLTDQKNGVLLYLAIKDKSFAIIGDKGIDNITPEDFWETVKNQMQLNFRNGDFLNGILDAIDEVGKNLAEFFPYNDDDLNELPDEISFYDN